MDREYMRQWNEVDDYVAKHAGGMYVALTPPDELAKIHESIGEYRRKQLAERMKKSKSE